MKSVSKFGAMAIISVSTMVLLNGCGSDGGGNDSGSGVSGGGGSGGAPSSVAGKTATGVITSAPNDPHWRIDFNGNGNYTHVENPYPAEYGTYSYTKTSANESTAVLHPNAGGQFSMHFHFNSSHGGTYTIPEATETGTFSIN
jgi:hypothetical protein